MKVEVHITEKPDFELKIKGDLMVLIALNKIIGELKDIESLSVLVKEGKWIK
jgi:hypothetical protein